MEGSSAVRDRLIDAAIHELEQNGIQAFSLRRVAQACGVSCAAPYQHFKDRQALLEAVAEALNRDWFARQADAVRSLEGNVGAQLRVICREYLQFLCDTPHFCALITQRDEATGKWHLSHLFDQSSLTKKLISQFAVEHRMTDQEVYANVCAIRAVLYGAAMMNQRDDMRLNAAAVDVLYRMIDSQLFTYEYSGCPRQPGGDVV